MDHIMVTEMPKRIYDLWCGDLAQR